MLLEAFCVRKYLLTGPSLSIAKQPPLLSSKKASAAELKVRTVVPRIRFITNAPLEPISAQSNLFSRSLTLLILGAFSFVVITVRPALRYGLVKSTFSARSGVIVSAETAASMLPLTSAGTRPSSVMEIICTSNPFRRPISRIRSMSKPSYSPFCEFTYSNGA